MSTNLTHDDFLHIAKLSRLPLTPQDDYIANQLSQAASYVDVLNELDINSVEPTYQVNAKKNIFRSDEITPSFSQKEALSQASSTYNGYFRTTPTINKKK
jgi:aspartyl-tRNA(Asn)/glutamyl-tRNA(Gln) amidotransferase subunit C